MRVAVLFVTTCAFSAALGVPVFERRNQGSVTDSTQTLLGKIEQLVESHNELVREIKAAGAESLSEFIKKAERRLENLELRRALEELEFVQSGHSSGSSDGIRDKPLKSIREFMIPDDVVPACYAIDDVFEQIIADLKNQIQEASKVISDWHNLLSEPGRAKIAAAKERITDLAQKIAETIRERRRAKETEGTTETSEYSTDPFYGQKLMVMMQDLLEETKDQLELRKSEVSESSIGAERELLFDLEELDTKLSASMESIRGMIQGVTGVDVLSSNIVSNLRRLLALKMQQLQQLARESGNVEAIRTLENDIANLRRRLIQAVQDTFQKP